MSIQQLNVSYIEAEDRLLLRVMANGSEEFRFWLTRSVMRTFLPQAAAWCAGVGAQGNEALRQAFAREAAAASADFSAPICPGTHFPLGEEPRLVSALRIVESADGSCRLQLLFADGSDITLCLEDSVLAATQRLLREITQAAHWGLLAETPTPQAQCSNNPERLLH
jgi:hypothetical protein